MMQRIVAVLGLGLLMAGCGDETNPRELNDPDTGRWYSRAQVERGEVIYEENCQVCHRERARGAEDWQTPLESGTYPPPPLDGRAHAWHHPLPQLKQTIAEGGIPYGGTMPGFEDSLDEEEMEAVIAYFQSFWSEETYEDWLERHP